MLSRLHRPADPARVYFCYSFGFTFCFVLTTTLNLVNMATRVGLDAFQMVVVGTVLEAVIFLCEVPTGLIADLISRRLSLLLGLIVVGVGFLVQATANSFALLLVAQVVWGLGYTLTSGADQAWLVDEIGTERSGPVFVRAQQLDLAATIAATLAAGALGLIDLRLPLAVSGAGLVLLGLGLAFVMTERGFTPTPPAERETFGQLRRSLREGLSLARRRPVVRTFLFVGLLVGLSSEAVDRLWTVHITHDFAAPPLPGVDDTVVLFAGIGLVGTLVSLLTSLAANRISPARMNALHPAGLMATLVGLQVFGILALALAGNLWLALAGLWLRSAAGTLAAPIRTAWLHRHLDRGVRATVGSLTSQADAIGQVAGGPPLGLLAGRAGIPVGLVVSAAILAPSGVLYGRLSATAPAGQACEESAGQSDDEKHQAAAQDRAEQGQP